MNKPISIIIPTFLAPNHLSLCIESIVKGQANPNNEILVIVDGHYKENKDVLERWKQYIRVVDLEVNQGLPRATNIGVSQASCDLVLIINDDNVMGKDFDKLLLEDYKDGVCITPNQIEPVQSIFKQFYIQDLGRNPLTFDLQQFYVQEKEISKMYGKQNGYVDNTGSTLPFLMSKLDFLRLGGWDELYGTQGLASDWDFFLKCSLSHLEMRRTYKTHTYHFGSVSTGIQRQAIEQQAWAYADFKWGSRILSDYHTNKKYLANSN